MNKNFNNFKKKKKKNGKDSDQHLLLFDHIP